MENLQEQIQNTQNILDQYIVESVDQYITETQQEMSVEELYSLCENTTSLIIESAKKKSKKQKPAGRTPGRLVTGPSDRPWKSGKLVRFSKLRQQNKSKLASKINESDVVDCSDEMIRILIAEGMLDTVQAAGDVASLIPGGIGRAISGVNAAISGIRALRGGAGNEGQGRLAAARLAGVVVPGGAIGGRVLGNLAARRFPGAATNAAGALRTGLGRLAANTGKAIQAGKPIGQAITGSVGKTLTDIGNETIGPAATTKLGTKLGGFVNRFMSRGTPSTGTPPSPPSTGTPPSLPSTGTPKPIVPIVKEHIFENAFDGITPNLLETVNKIVNKKKVNKRNKTIGENGINGINLAAAQHVSGSIPLVSGQRGIVDPLMARGVFGAGFAESVQLKEYVKNPVENKAKKQKFKIVFTEGGKKLEAFAGSERGVKKAIYGKKNFRIYSASGSDITVKFKGK